MLLASLETFQYSADCCRLVASCYIIIRDTTSFEEFHTMAKGSGCQPICRFTFIFLVHWIITTEVCEHEVFLSMRLMEVNVKKRKKKNYLGSCWSRSTTVTGGGMGITMGCEMQLRVSHAKKRTDPHCSHLPQDRWHRVWFHLILKSSSFCSGLSGRNLSSFIL